MKELVQSHIPDVAHNGILLKVPDPQPIIREVAETNRQWDYSAECAKLYRRADVILDRFYNGVLIPGFEGKLPAPLIAVEPMNIRTLAAYRVVPDEYGLPFKLTFNEAHFIEAKQEDGTAQRAWRWAEWSQMETLTHELGHHWQQLKGKNPYKPGKITHNKEFAQKLLDLGIYSTPGHGAHFQVADAEGPFGLLMKEWGIPRPADVETLEVPPKTNWWSALFDNPVRGRSSLRKYQCPECGLAVRVGVKRDPKLLHDPCTEKKGEKVFFVQDSLKAVIYEAPKYEGD